MIQQQFIHIVRRYCEKKNIFQKGDKVLIALSGGADSVFLVRILLELAERWELTLSLIHVNHGIRGEEAGRDEKFCLAFADKMGLPIQVFHGDVPALAREKKMSMEEAAREYRYECINALLEENALDKAAIAHHQDDQAETVLFQMLRGSSLKGLGGMKAVNGKIVRPLLALDHQDIVSELERIGQDWCEDSTNGDRGYQRNRLRMEILPMLEEYVNPSSAEHLSRMASQLQQIQDFVENELDRKTKELVLSRDEDKTVIDAVKLLEIPIALQMECVYQLLVKQAGKSKDITSRHIDCLISLAEGESGKRADLPYGMVAGKDYDRLWIKMKDSDCSENEDDVIRYEGEQEGIWKRTFSLTDGSEVEICLHKEIFQEQFEQNHRKIPKNNCTKWLDYAKIENALEFRHPEPGDFLWLKPGSQEKKQLNRLLIDLHVPREDRKKLWVLADGNHIAWIPELARASAGFYVSEDTREILCIDAIYQRRSI